ncbi:helix-turn-helix domain-containing protein [Methylobacterium nonmethylotrophicum]|uniref:AraC family transcriptional regulator n=1 Tax=Methylobacterium nonmethylotrophicum TaxID=1141884 RepID=A0A4Z0NQ45_9HYPH|nr:AraC family transcriptional regulator [Methylobacterium nonmethylotrophicum]TGD98333.1 AraC family transcriptional regulator [Methylobacterium nonmethylotrophicum]
MSLTTMQARDIGAWPKNVALARSTGRGWRHIHAQHVAVEPWTGTLDPVGNPCLGYCVNRPAQIRRRIGRGGPAESSTLRPRQFHLIPAHDESEWQRRGRSEMLAMHLDQGLIDDTARRMWSASVSRVELEVPLGTADPLLEQLALAILEMMREAPDPSASLYVDELVHAMVVRLVRSYTAQGRSSRAGPDSALPERADLGRVRDLVEARLAEDLSLETLADAIGASPRSLSRAVLQHWGTTVHQYVLSRRLERAKTMLRATDHTITSIALDTGFSSQSHLATAFRKLTGVTPKAFRLGGR